MNELKKELEACEIIFVRHGKLALPFKDHSKMTFGVIADLSTEKLDPSVDTTFNSELIKELNLIITLEKIERIYTSPVKRCQEDATLIKAFMQKKVGKSINIEFLSELKEIAFDLRKICQMSEKSSFNIDEINDAVFKAMINGRNCELALSVCNRVDKIFSMLREKNNPKALLITHDFFMRVIELYIKKREITYKGLRGTKRNLYLKGFATNKSLTKFIPF